MNDGWNLRTVDSDYQAGDPERNKLPVLPPAIAFGHGAVMEVPKHLPKRTHRYKPLRAEMMLSPPSSHMSEESSEKALSSRPRTPSVESNGKHRVPHDIIDFLNTPRSVRMEAPMSQPIYQPTVYDRNNMDPNVPWVPPSPVPPLIGNASFPNVVQGRPVDMPVGMPTAYATAYVYQGQVAQMRPQQLVTDTQKKRMRAIRFFLCFVVFGIILMVVIPIIKSRSWE